jgi:hypothetical protein
LESRRNLAVIECIILQNEEMLQLLGHSVMDIGNTFGAIDLSSEMMARNIASFYSLSPLADSPGAPEKDLNEFLSFDLPGVDA